MTKWEYKLQGWNTNAIPNDSLEVVLNSIGKDGWEVVTVNWPNDGIVLFKRRKD